MSKLLLLADVHIHDYFQYNITKNFRLDQFDRLADRIVEECEEQHIRRIIIAGDLIQVAVVRPHVQHRVWGFVDKISAPSTIEEVLIIVGNHDADSKNNELSYDTSIVTLLNGRSKVRVVNKEVMDIDGIKFGFQSWQPDHPLDWLDDKVDILINHFTDAGEAWSGQTIDNSKFHAMFFGDIHKSYIKTVDDSTYISIGNPIGHRLGDQMDGQLLVLDTDTSDEATGYLVPISNNRQVGFKWVDTIIPGRYDFLRIYRPDKKPENAGEYCYDIEVPYAVVTSNATDHIDLVKSIDVNSVMNRYVGEMNLEEVHRKVVDEVNKSGYIQSQISLNFSLITLKVHNYRSIEDLELDFQGGVTLISGDFGAGKTSVLSALEYVLCGNSRVRNQIREGSDGEMYVDLTLEYLGVFYRILRGNGLMKFWVGDEDQVRCRSHLPPDSDNYYNPNPYNSINDCSWDAWEKLSFLQHWKLMYLDQMSVGLFASMGQNDRINILSKLFGWEIVQKYNESVSNLIHECTSGIDLVRTEIEKYKKSIETLSELGTTIDEADYSSMKSEQEVVLSSTKESLDKWSAIEADEARLSSLSDALSALDTPAPDKPDALNSDPDPEVVIRRLEDEATTNEEKQRELNLKWSNLASEIAEIKASVTQSNEAISDLNRQKSSRPILENRKVELDTRMNVLNAKVAELVTRLEGLSCSSTCHACGQNIHNESALNQLRSSVVEELKSVNRERSQLTTDIEYNQAALDTIDIDLIDKDIHERRAWLVSAQDSITIRLNSQNSIQDELVRVRGAHKVITNTLASIKSYMTAIESWKSQVEKRDEMQSAYVQLRAGIADRKSSLPDRSSIQAAYDDARNKITEYHGKIIEQDQIKTRLNKIHEIESEILPKLMTNIEDLEVRIVDLQKYSDLTSRNGVVTRSILTSCAEMLSTEDLVVTTMKELASGDMSPELSLAMKVRGRLIPYSNLSGGQLFLADMRFMMSLIEVAGGTGLLILDEAFKYLPPQFIDVIAAEVKGLNAKDILVITHEQSYPYNDRVLHVEMDSVGISHYSYK